MTKKHSGDRPIVAGVPVSHPDRVVYPQPRTSKLALARYYEAVGEVMLPHMQGRPLTLVHCPEGLPGKCAYVRHTRAWGPSALRRVRIQEKTKVGEYLVADSVAAIVSLAQMACARSTHGTPPTTISSARTGSSGILIPDRQVRGLRLSAARVVRAVLETLGLTSWVKTTGGRGLHVVVPIARRRDWSECLTFARNVAQFIERHDPTLFTTALPKRGRERKVLIDYLRNNRTNTAVAAFSTRARPGAPVSTPITWDELGDKMEPFTIVNVLRRLAKLSRDPWVDYWSSHQRVTAAAFRSVEGADSAAP